MIGRDEARLTLGELTIKDIICCDGIHLYKSYLCGAVETEWAGGAAIHRHKDAAAEREQGAAAEAGRPLLSGGEGRDPGASGVACIARA